MRIADDFGLGRGHDRVILSLLDQGRLTGTSVMVNDAIAPGDIAHLVVLRAAGAQVGLHLNLTQPLPGLGRVWPLTRLMRGPVEGVAAALEAQLRAFVALFGSLPDYYDGHQHVHCLPAARPLVAGLPRGPQTWVRVPLPTTWAGRARNLRAAGLKAAVVLGFAARARQVWAREGVPMNRDFTGFLRLDRPEAVRRWLPRLLAAAGPDCLVMVHPGAAEDPLQCAGHAAAARAIEAEILRGTP